MPRPLIEIIAQLRHAIANGSIHTTLIQTEDLEVLCDAAEGRSQSPHAHQLVSTLDAALEKCAELRDLIDRT